jgi:hypothetical protein
MHAVCMHAYIQYVRIYARTIYVVMHAQRMHALYMLLSTHNATHDSLHVYMYVCMYVCMQKVCKYVSMYLRMYVCILEQFSFLNSLI